MLNTKMSNAKCFVEYDRGTKQISMADYTDAYNEPRGYTTSKRGLEGAWLELIRAFDPKMTMYDVVNFLWERGVKSHTYCSMD